MNNAVIIALDFADRDEVTHFIQHFRNRKMFFKVGMELFYREGMKFVAGLVESGHSVFLDLKLHDIPNTVKRTMRGLASLGVDLINVHAAGGKEMMAAALDGLQEGTTPGLQRPRCLAVTQLTSLSEQMMREELLIDRQLPEVVLSYARLAKESGLDGVICSPWEVPGVKAACGNIFLTVTPGIRLAGDGQGDQRRVATPLEARKLGSDAIVVGRSVTRAADPLAAYSEVLRQWEGSL